MATTDARADEILHAATNLIQKRGYNGFSFRDVAAEVGIRSASIHYHFPTKSDLAISATVAYREAFSDILAGINENHASAIEKLRAYGDVFLSTLKSNGNVCLCGMLAGESEAIPNEVLQEVNKFFEEQCAWLNSVFQQGQIDGDLRSEIDGSQFATSFFSALEGAMIMARGLQQPDILSNSINQQLASVAINARKK